MKKIIILLAGLLIVFSCQSTPNTRSDGDAQENEQTHSQEQAHNPQARGNPVPVSGNLSVWSFTDEVQQMLNDYFKPVQPNVNLGYAAFPTEQFPIEQFYSRLDSVFALGARAPDVVTLDDSVVRKYVEGGQLLDLTDIYEANKNKLLAYPVEIGSYNGRVYALSWQAAPGAMFYRRSLAKKYLGTDDPATIQARFADRAKLLETAKTLKDRSGGNCVLVGGINDLYYPFVYQRTNPWIVNRRLFIDPVMEQYMDMCRTIAENNYHGNVEQWSEGWYAGIDDKLYGWDGKKVEIFSYFLPTWGLHYVLKTNGENTAGDWAMIPGPGPYRWGGTWLAAWKGTQNPDAAKELIRYLTTDDHVMENYVNATGDMTSNITVQDRVKNKNSEPFLAGQNQYALFADISRHVNGKLSQANDAAINELFQQAIFEHLWEGKPKAQALSDFRVHVLNRLNIH